MTMPLEGRVLCFGEMLLRLSPPGRERMFQLPQLDAHFGGAEANVAVGLARMGVSSAVVTRLPTGPIGDGAMEALRRNGVDTGAISRADGRMGIYYLAPGAGLRAASIVYDRAGSLFEHSHSTDFDWPRLVAEADWLHMSGITPALGPAAAEMALVAARAAKAAGVAISFDGNYRARLWERWTSDPRSILSELVAESDLLFGNHRDISLLLGETFAGDGPERRRIAATAAFEAFPGLRWIASTARHVVDAEHNRMSARLDSPDAEWHVDEIAVGGIIDRIGTGDAFAAGVLHGLIRGEPVAAVETGLALAVLKHYTPGDFSVAGPAEVAAFLNGERDVRR
jgi:2-dehydro-3-deoxygluconokinase